MPVHLDVAFGFVESLLEVFTFGQYLLDYLDVVGDRLFTD